MDDIHCENSTLKADIKHKIKIYLQNKYKDEELKELLYTASFLDHRFKMDYIPSVPEDSSNDPLSVVKERILKEGIQSVTDESDDHSDNTVSSTAESREMSDSGPPYASTKKKTLGSILRKKWRNIFA